MTDQPDPMAEALADLPPASTAHGDPDRADTVARGARLLQLRSAGMTYEQIAREEGYSDKSSARQALLRALDRHEAENVVELRTLENMRLDSDERVLRAIISDTTAPAATRLRAIDTRTRLSARRARMNGLDAPVAVTISAGVEAALEDALRDLDEVLREQLGDAVVPGEVSDVTDERMEG